MANKLGEMQLHEEVGKVKEKKGEVKDWTNYNKKMRQLSIEAAAEQKAKKKEREYNEGIDAGDEVASIWLHGNGTVRTYGIPDMSEIKGTRAYREAHGE